MQGLGISPFEVRNVVGVVKCYMTRVGSGPFFTEQHGDVGTKLQAIGGEIGVSTGRRRRCGWLDLVILKYSAAINHYTCKLSSLFKSSSMKTSLLCILDEGMLISECSYQPNQA